MNSRRPRQPAAGTRCRQPVAPCARSVLPVLARQLVSSSRHAISGLACAGLLLAATGRASSPALDTNRFSENASPPASGEKTQLPGFRRLPRVAPDYRGVVIPPNLAPLNLAIREPGIEYRLRVSGSHGQPIDLHQPHPHFRFPPAAWKELLQANRGGALRWNIAVRDPAGDWTAYAPFENTVAQDEIDPYVVYRRLLPLYSTYKRLEIWQRNIETFEDKPVLRNAAIGHGCVNCHTFQQGAPDRFAISLRGRFGTPTLLIESNRISKVDSKMGYLSWHPNGTLLAFAANEVRQSFHVAGPINRDVYHLGSDLGILHVQHRTIEKPAAIAAPDRDENWPCWAPDGRSLYYCSGPDLPLAEVRNIRYDIVRIPYDPDRNRWGNPETLISGAEHRFSAQQPRPSPDGRHIVFTVSESGSFPILRSDSDLHLLRLDTLEWERLPINSGHADSWHCWSSNGRWLAFSSRGLDGVFARLFITHVDPAARFSKPLLLPQEDPTYYDTCIDNFNTPELVRGPVQVSEAQLVGAVDAPAKRNQPAAHEMSQPDHSQVSGQLHH